MAALPRAIASMSSEFSGSYPATNCIDEDTSSVCHGTNNEANPWLRVTFGGLYPVSYVQIYNRVGGFELRLGCFDVWLQDAGGAWAQCHASYGGGSCSCSSEECTNIPNPGDVVSSHSASEPWPILCP